MRPFFGCPPYGGRTTIFNNNYYSMPPMMGCGCQSNFFDKMYKWSIMSSLMQNLFRPMVPYYPQQSYYPGLYLSGGGTEGAGGASKSSSEQNLKNLQEFYGDCRFSSITEDGVTRYYCSTPNGTVYTDTSLTDLQKQLEINGVTPKQKKEKSEIKPDVSSVKRDGEVDDAEPATDTNPTENNPGTAGQQTTRRVHVPETWKKLNDEWINYHYNNGNRKPTDIDEFIEKLTRDLAFPNLDVKKLRETVNLMSRLKQDLIEYNPSCFNDDGSIKDSFDWKKLDIPSEQALKNDPYNLSAKNDPSTPRPSSVRTKAADNKNISIATYSQSGADGKAELKWNKSGFRIYKSSNNGTNIDADAVLVMNGQEYNIHSGSNTADFYSLLGRTSNQINNYKLIDANGHFNPESGYSYYLTDTSGNRVPYGLGTKTVNGKKYFVLICGKNRFSMDDVMCGNVPFEQVNGNVNNPYAI